MITICTYYLYLTILAIHAMLLYTYLTIWVNSNIEMDWFSETTAYVAAAFSASMFWLVGALLTGASCSIAHITANTSSILFIVT